MTLGMVFVGGGAGGTPGGGVTRRKLVSTSKDAATGMHSTSSITMAANVLTLAFWYRPTTNSNNGSNTLFASHSGQLQVYTENASGSQDELIARMDGSSATSPSTPNTAVDTWCHVVMHFGLNHDSTKDISILIDGSEDASHSASGALTEMASAGTHYLLGDDASGSPTDDGFIGEVFDFCVFDGIVALADTNYDTGSWSDLTSTGLAALKYRLDGQNESDPGEDSSGNGHDFTVENSGVTLSDTALPSGANP